MPAQGCGSACGQGCLLVADHVEIPPILLVRLKSRGPNGGRVGECRRACHLVPVPRSGQTPDVLRAYCGRMIAPGTADLLDRISGMPCEACVARSPIPAFALTRVLPSGVAEDAVGGGDEVAAWWDLGLQPEQRIAVRFVLLLLLQDPARRRPGDESALVWPLSVGEIAVWLGQDTHLVTLVMLVQDAAGWVEQLGPADLPWLERRFRLTELGVVMARRLLATGLTPTFMLLADRLGLDISVVSSPDTPNLGGGDASPDTAPTEHHPDANGRPTQ
jgi:hypothetical protein